jgi:uncharacterized membrane protein
LTARVAQLERLISGERREAAARRSAPAPPINAPKEPHTYDLESRIGGHWLNRVGIVAVLTGVSYFLKYAFDNEWVGPAGRVVIGFIAGVALVFWSEHVRRSGYGAFSHSLKATGIGILYLSLWACSQLYHLIPISLAFLAMMSVTAATIALALWQNAELIAAFAAIGAFLTPVVLSTGENNAAVLFTYVTLLDAGALFLFHYRSWMRLLVGSYIGTLILYSSWHSTFYTPNQFPIAITSISVIFVIFGLVPFLQRPAPEALAIQLIVLANAAVYFYELWELFQHAAATRPAALAAIALSSVYFTGAHFLTSRTLAATAQIHAAIGSAFLVIAVPIALDAHWITIGWLAEGAALIQTSRRTRNKTLDFIGGIAFGLGVCRLLVVDQYNPRLIFFNERIAISALAIAVLALAAITWARLERDIRRQIVPILIVAMNVVALVSLNREVTDAFRGILRDFAYSALWMAYGAGLMFAGFWKASRFLRWQALILIFVTICKVFLYDTSSLDRGYRILSFIALGMVLLVTSFLYQRGWFKFKDT